jgi:hypothetical protein
LEIPSIPERLHQPVHTAGGDAGQVTVRHDLYECPLGTPARLEEPAREVRALAELGDLERDRARARVPGPLAVAVSAVDPLGRALAVGGAADRVALGAHERLGERLHHLAQKVGVGVLEPLAQPGLHVHRGLDHRFLRRRVGLRNRSLRGRGGGRLPSALSGPSDPPPRLRRLWWGAATPRRVSDSVHHAGGANRPRHWQAHRPRGGCLRARARALWSGSMRAAPARRPEAPTTSSPSRTSPGARAHWPAIRASRR